MSKGSPRTIYLTPELEERLLTRALSLGRSASWVIREILDRELSAAGVRATASGEPRPQQGVTATERTPRDATSDDKELRYEKLT